MSNNPDRDQLLADLADTDPLGDPQHVQASLLSLVARARKLQRPVGVQRAETPGCPSCYRDDISVTVDMVGNVDLLTLGKHVDNVEWGAPYDIDINDARRVTCRACGWARTVDGDTHLYEVLGISAHDSAP